MSVMTFIKRLYKSSFALLFQRKGFEIYSDYCNNHPLATDELYSLQRDAKFQCFFEVADFILFDGK